MAKKYSLYKFKSKDSFHATLYWPCWFQSSSSLIAVLTGTWCSAGMDSKCLIKLLFFPKWLFCQLKKILICFGIFFHKGDLCLCWPFIYIQTYCRLESSVRYFLFRLCQHQSAWSCLKRAKADETRYRFPLTGPQGQQGNTLRKLVHAAQPRPLACHCLTSDNLHSAQRGVVDQVSAERLQRSPSLKHLRVCQIPNDWVRLAQTIHLRASGELPNPKNPEQRSIFFGHVQAFGNHFTSSSWIYNFKQEDIRHIPHISSEEEEEAVCVLTLSCMYSDIYARITVINTNKSVISPSWESNTAKQDADTGRRACLERIYWTSSAKSRAHLPNAQKRFHMCR